MTNITIENDSSKVTFYKVPANIAKSIKTLLHAIEAEETTIISGEEMKCKLTLRKENN